MVRVCCVRRCKNIWSPHCDISFFGFPLKDENCLENWKRVVPTTYQITKYTTICSDHFSNTSFTYKGGRRFLNKRAVPTIFHASLKDEAQEADVSLEELLELQPCIVESQREDYDLLRDITSIAQDNVGCTVTQQQSSSSSKLATQGCHECSYVDRGTQTSPVPSEMQKHVGIQVSPHRLPPSEIEEQLRKKVKLLTCRLHRRESRIMTLTELLADFRKNDNLNEVLEDTFMNRFSR